MSYELFIEFIINSTRQFFIIGILFCCVALSSCAGTPKYTTVTPELRTQFMQDLKEGNLTLTSNTLECAFSFSDSRSKILSLMKTTQYAELAELVMKIGYGEDIAYCSLGYAAAGLGYYEAALKYFNYSLTLYNDPVATHHCRNELTGNLLCGGIDLGEYLPGMIAEAQANVENQKKPFGYLTKWEGKDPVRNGLLSDPKFMDSLEASLGKQRAKQLLIGWGRGEPVASEVARVDDNMVFGACKPNDQCYHQAIIFISMIDGAVQACWQDAASSKSLSDFWLSPGGKSRKLPAGYCEMHDDTDLSKMFRDNTSDKRKL